MADSIAYDEAARRAAVLKMQAKKNQIFGESLPEAIKLAEAGLMHLRAAEALPMEERTADLKEAATCMSRAKRLCRGLLKEAR
jgi:hypothetical protein